MELTRTIFYALNKSNKALFVYDKDSEVLNAYLRKYENIGNLLIIGEYDGLEKPYNIHGHAITHLHTDLEQAYLDESLNAMVDFVYVDATQNTHLCFSYLKDVCNLEHTSLIIKVKNYLTVSRNSSPFLKQFSLEVFELNDEESLLVYVP
jgi:hypothetical protein